MLSLTTQACFDLALISLLFIKIEVAVVFVLGGLVARSRQPVLFTIWAIVLTMTAVFQTAEFLQLLPLLALGLAFGAMLLAVVDVIRERDWMNLSVMTVLSIIAAVAIIIWQ